MKKCFFILFSICILSLSAQQLNTDELFERYKTIDFIVGTAHTYALKVPQKIKKSSFTGCCSSGAIDFVMWMPVYYEIGADILIHQLKYVIGKKAAKRLKRKLSQFPMETDLTVIFEFVRSEAKKSLIS